MANAKQQYTNETVMDENITRKQKLAKKVSPTTEMAEELCEQIEICEEMCCPISETQIREWSKLSINAMLAKCRTLKFGDTRKTAPLIDKKHVKKSLTRYSFA